MNLLGYIDDNLSNEGKLLNGYVVLGSIEILAWKRIHLL